MNPWVPPNTPGSFSSTGPVSNYTYEPPSRTFFEDYSGRVDHQLNSTNSSCTAATPITTKTGWDGPPAFRYRRSTAPTAISRRSPSRTTPSAPSMFSARPLSMNFGVGYYRARNDTFVPSYNQNWARKLGIPNDQPAADAVFQLRRMASGYTARPRLNTMYGLTVPGPSRRSGRRSRCATISARWTGRTPSRWATRSCDFRANYCQLGQPSGIFQFDQYDGRRCSRTGSPSPNTGNLLAAFELGAVRPANFSTLHHHLAAARLRSTACISRTTGSSPGT